MFPRIALTGQYGLESSVLSDFLKSPYGLLGANLLTPIFNSGKNIAKYKAQKAVYEQACYGYEKSVLNAFKEVNNAIVNFNKMKEAYESKRKLEQARRVMWNWPNYSISTALLIIWMYWTPKGDISMHR